MSSFPNLPHTSAAFHAHVASHPLQPNEWLPCPRCGSATVQPPAGKGVGMATGAAFMGCSTLMLGFLCLVVLAFSKPVGIVLTIISAAIVLGLPWLGARIGGTYACSSCQFRWSFAQAVDAQRAALRLSTDLRPNPRGAAPKKN